MKEITKKISDLEKELGKLGKRSDELEGDYQRIKAESEQAERLKSDAMKRVALGDINDSDYAAIKSQAAAVSEQLQEVESMRDFVFSERKRLAEELESARAELRKSETHRAREIVQEQIDKFAQANVQEAKQLFVARAIAHGGASPAWADFLAMVFKLELTPEERQAIAAEFKQKNGLKL